MEDNRHSPRKCNKSTLNTRLTRTSTAHNFPSARHKTPRGSQRTIRSSENSKKTNTNTTRGQELKKVQYSRKQEMAQMLNLFLVMIAAFAMKNEAFGGIEERLQRIRGKLNGVTGNQPKPSYNERLDDLVALLKTGTLKALCESEKVSPTWCEYKQLLELNTVYRLQQKSVRRKSSGSLCWPGLPLPCKGLVPARNARALDDYEPDNEFDNDGKYDARYDTDNEIDSGNDADSVAEEKRGMKCRPGMANCRRKKGKRTISKAKVCPQGWMFC